MAILSNRPLAPKAPEVVVDPEESSLLGEETEQLQREADVYAIRSRTEGAQAIKEAYKPSTSTIVKPTQEEVSKYSLDMLTGGLTESTSALLTSPVLGPEEEDPGSLPRNVVNFVIGEDMAIWGVKWDAEGFKWNFQNMKDQWSEEPLWSTVTLGFQLLTLVAPYAKALQLGARGMELGRRGLKAAPLISKVPLLKKVSPAGFKYYPHVGARKVEGIVSEFPENISMAMLEESRPWFAAPEFLNMSEKGARKAEIDMLRDFNVVNLGHIVSKWGDNTAKELYQQHGDDAYKYMSDVQLENLYHQIPKRTMERMRRTAQKYNTSARLAAKLKLSQDKNYANDVVFSTGDQMKLAFNRWFGNSYFDKVMGVTPDQNMVNEIGSNLSKWNPPENIRSLMSAPPPQSVVKNMLHQAIYDHAVRDGVGNLVPPPSVISQEYQGVVDRTYSVLREQQRRALDMGLISDAEAAANPMHFTLVRRRHKVQGGELQQYARANIVNLKDRDPVTGKVKKVIDPKTGKEVASTTEHIILNTGLFPRLQDPSLLPRRADWDKVYDALENGELFDTPEEFFLHTVVNDELLMRNFEVARDVVMDERYVMSAAELAGKYEGKRIPPEWVNLNDLVKGTSAGRLKRMIAKKAGNDVEKTTYLLGSTDPGSQVLPYMRAGLADKLFGGEGIFEQSKIAASWAEALTTVYKSMKTGFNLPTHFQNTLGNMVFLAQSGMHPLKADTWRLARDLTENFRGYTKAKRAGTEMAWVTRNADKMIEYNGFRMPFVDMLGLGTDPARNRLMQEHVVESAFEYIEGWEHLRRVYGRVSEADSPTLKSFVGSMLKVHDPSFDLKTGGAAPIADMTKPQQWYKKGITGFLNTATAAYLGEDIVPKMMLLMKNQADGMTLEGAITEVGRRLPMYNSVGKKFKSTRRVILPWVTFPAEAARITKNNIMDDPLKMLPWLWAPQVLQSTAFALGMTGEGETKESLEEAKRGIALWAQQGPETVVYGGRQGLAGAGGLIGGTTGALMGGLTKGPLGAVLGSLAGGIAGAGASYFLDKDGEQLRGGVLNWLPHSSFMMSEMRAPDFSFTKVKDVWETVPAEPFAILKPLYETFFGRDQYGNDVVTGGFGDSIKKGVAGYIGFLSPPIVQRYGFGTTTPDVALFGNEWTGGAVMAAAAGALGLALTKGKGPLIPGLKAALQTNKAGLAAAVAAGAAAGSTADVSRIYTDSGLTKDIYGKEGTTAQDFFFNNIGMMRSYRSTPESRIANEDVTKRHLQELRSYLGRHLQYYAANGMDEQMIDTLKKIHITFKAQYEDASLSQRRYRDYIEYYMSSIGQHPALRSISQEELVRRLYKASDYAEQARGMAQEEMYNLLLQTRAEQITTAAARRKRK